MSLTVSLWANAANRMNGSISWSWSYCLGFVKMSYFIGVDSSTTATKALLMAENGRVVGVALSSYDYETPQPLWSEQQPELWWTGTINSIRQLLADTGIDPNEVKGIGLTGQMHGLVLLDKDGKVLRPALLWNDQRTGAECDQMRAKVGQQRLIDITGNDALTGFTAPKILWVKNNEPEIYTQIVQILLPKDYVRFKLTGGYAIDKAGGAGTQLFDVRQRDWSAELLDALEINADWLPPTFEGTAVTGTLTLSAAEATGLPVGIPRCRWRRRPGGQCGWNRRGGRWHCCPQFGHIRRRVCQQ